MSDPHRVHNGRGNASYIWTCQSKSRTGGLRPGLPLRCITDADGRLLLHDVALFHTHHDLQFYSDTARVRKTSHTCAKWPSCIHMGGRCRRGALEEKCVWEPTCAYRTPYNRVRLEMTPWKESLLRYACTTPHLQEGHACSSSWQCPGQNVCAVIVTSLWTAAHNNAVFG